MVAKLEASFLTTRACSPLFTKKTKWSIKRPTSSRASLSLNCFLQKESATPCTGILGTSNQSNHTPVLVDLDGECQSPEEPQIRAIITEKAVGNQPSLGTFLEGLQLLLDKRNLGWIARICWVIELRHELEDVLAN